MALKPGWYSPVSMIITHYLISLLFDARISVDPEACVFTFNCLA